MNAGRGSSLRRRGALAAACIATASAAAAQDVSLNYERLSSVEEPVATEIGGVTFVLKGLVDAALVHDAEDGDTEAGLTGNFQMGALTQLSNRWRVGLTYFGQYVTDETLSPPPGDRYTDRAALSVGSMWGTVAGGNVSGIVREDTRRRRGAGNAALAFDDALGGLTEWGGGYTGRFGPWVVGAAVDEDADFEIGATFRRPMDNTDYRLTLRIGRGVHAAADGSRSFDSTAIGAVGEVIYGSLSFDVGLGYERLASSGPDTERWYLSSGIRGKTGVFGWSVEAHYGRIEGEHEVSAALGVQYDVARGLSANLGLNHAKARVDVGDTRLVDTSDTKAALSLRYSF